MEKECTKRCVLLVIWITNQSYNEPSVTINLATERKLAISNVGKDGDAGISYTEEIKYSALKHRKISEKLSKHSFFELTILSLIIYPKGIEARLHEKAWT